MPLPTLHLTPHDVRRTARGESGGYLSFGIYMLKYTRIGLEIYYHSIPVNYLPLLNISAGWRIGCALGQHPGVRRWFPRYGTWTGQLLILIFNFENFF